MKFCFLIKILLGHFLIFSIDLQEDEMKEGGARLPESSEAESSEAAPLAVLFVQASIARLNPSASAAATASKSSSSGAAPADSGSSSTSAPSGSLAPT